MAERACHAFASTTRFGLTQALGPMQSLSLFERFAIGFCLVVAYLFFLTLLSRKSEKARRPALLTLGTSLIALGIAYLVLAWLLFLDSGVLYHTNRGNLIATEPGNSVISLLLAGSLASLPALLLAGFGWLIVRNALGPNNSFKPSPLRGLGKGP